MDAAAKQQIVERLKQANSILVTVSTNPSVDQLAACIGLTLLLNRMGKHATAVFSGKVPSTLEFLQPEKTIETNTDSLRDFIISLDKNKADKLRYKVEDQVVRIFITPYKTSLSEKDLVFSQGDFNVEVVMALGVHERSQIDSAITAHGRILHDATVVSINSGAGNVPQLGQINWQDPMASSLCEMIVGLSDDFGQNLIDNQMATAFLTGIVAETERFSNGKTSPKVMSASAQLMAAGANQQLIVAKLEPPPPPPPAPVKKYTPEQAPPEPKAPAPEDTEAKLAEGTVSIPHDVKKPAEPAVSTEIHIDEQGNLVTQAELEQNKEDELKKDEPEPPLTPAEGTAIKPPPIPGPHTLLDPQAYHPAMEPAFTAATEPEWADPYNSVSLDPLAAKTERGFIGHSEKKVKPPEEDKPSVPDESAKKSASPDVDSARSAVEQAIATGPDSGYEEPRKDLNANFVELDEPAGDKKTAEKPAPPPGPPPLVLPVEPAVPAAKSTAKAKK